MTSLLYSFIRWCPGGIGILLRQKLYPYLLGKCGHKVLIGRFVSFENFGKIHLGNNVVIGDKVILDACDTTCPGAAIVLEDTVFVGLGSRLSAAVGKGRIVLEAGCSLGSFCDIGTAGDITIEQDVLLAAYCKIGAVPTAAGDKLQGPKTGSVGSGAIRIESGCWLGVRSAVRPGAAVGQGAIVGAHAVVRSSLPSYVIAVGDPAEVLRDRPNRHGAATKK